MDENGRVYTNAAPSAPDEPIATEENVIPKEDPNATIFERQDGPIDREAYAFRNALQGNTTTSDLGVQVLNQRLDMLEAQMNQLQLENQALKRHLASQGTGSSYFSKSTGSEMPELIELPAGKSTKVKVFDQTWKLVKEIPVSGSSKLDPSELQLPDALYILVLMIDNEEADYKVVNMKRPK